MKIKGTSEKIINLNRLVYNKIKNIKIKDYKINIDDMKMFLSTLDDEFIVDIGREDALKIYIQLYKINQLLKTGDATVINIKKQEIIYDLTNLLFDKKQKLKSYDFIDIFFTLNDKDELSLLQNSLFQIVLAAIINR